MNAWCVCAPLKVLGHTFSESCREAAVISTVGVTTYMNINICYTQIKYMPTPCVYYTSGVNC